MRGSLELYAAPYSSLQRANNPACLSVASPTSKATAPLSQLQRTENIRDGSAGCLQEWSLGFTTAIEVIRSYLSIWVIRIQKFLSVADKKAKVPPRTDSISRGVANDTSWSSRSLRVAMSR